jgi:hypothetical protein
MSHPDEWSHLETYNNPNATPRDRALAACELGRAAATQHPKEPPEALEGPAEGLAWEWAARAAVVAREEAGIADANRLLGSGDLPDFSQLEARLRQIKYTVFHLEMPADAIERLLALPEPARRALGILGVRFPDEVARRGQGEA